MSILLIYCLLLLLLLTLLKKETFTATASSCCLLPEGDPPRREWQPLCSTRVSRLSGFRGCGFESVTITAVSGPSSEPDDVFVSTLNGIGQLSRDGGRSWHPAAADVHNALDAGGWTRPSMSTISMLVPVNSQKSRLLLVFTNVSGGSRAIVSYQVPQGLCCCVSLLVYALLSFGFFIHQLVLSVAVSHTASISVSHILPPFLSLTLPPFLSLTLPLTVLTLPLCLSHCLLLSCHCLCASHTASYCPDTASVPLTLPDTHTAAVPAQCSVLGRVANTFTWIYQLTPLLDFLHQTMPYRY